MIYGYIRVSTDKQTVENQRFEINKFAKKQELYIDEWIEETISGTISPNKRNLGKLLAKTKKGDIIICSELSRLGKDLTSKVLAFAFSISAEIERELISQRTKHKRRGWSCLATGLSERRKKSEGIVLGHPKGQKNTHYKLCGQTENIKQMLYEGKSKLYICKYYNICYQTLYSFMQKEGIPY